MSIWSNCLSGFSVEEYWYLWLTRVLVGCTIENIDSGIGDFYSVILRAKLDTPVNAREMISAV